MRSDVWPVGWWREMTDEPEEGVKGVKGACGLLNADCVNVSASVDVSTCLRVDDPTCQRADVSTCGGDIRISAEVPLAPFDCGSQRRRQAGMRLASFEGRCAE